MRLIGIYLSCYAIPKNEFNEMLKIADSDAEDEIIKQFMLIAGFDKVKSATRMHTSISKNDFNEYKSQYEGVDGGYDILRT